MTTLADAHVQLDALREQLRDIAERLELLRSYL
jgi:hypothetical protein